MGVHLAVYTRDNDSPDKKEENESEGSKNAKTVYVIEIRTFLLTIWLWILGTLTKQYFFPNRWYHLYASFSHTCQIWLNICGLLYNHDVFEKWI